MQVIEKNFDKLEQNLWDQLMKTLYYFLRNRSVEDQLINIEFVSNKLMNMQFERKRFFHYYKRI